jgi:hypothetical protein
VVDAGNILPLPHWKGVHYLLQQHVLTFPNDGGNRRLALHLFSSLHEGWGELLCCGTSLLYSNQRKSCFCLARITQI